MKKKISIILAEDHRIVREGIRKLLEGEDDFSVVAGAGTGREAVELVDKLRPEIVVMDISMPQLNGLEACRQLVAKAARSRVLILSTPRTHPDNSIQSCYGQHHAPDHQPYGLVSR